jgi:hypothetical protein
MIETETSPSRIIDIEDLGFDRGAHLLIKKALADIPVGERIGVRGCAPDLAVHLRGWCRAQGHEIAWPESGSTGDEVHPPGVSPLVAWVIRGSATTGRWRHAETAGATDPRQAGAVVDRPSPGWGLAARGARVEAGGPEFHFGLNSKEEVWADSVPRLYLQAAAAQWNPATAIEWDAPFELPPEIELAVVQVMTFLIEN